VKDEALVAYCDRLEREFFRRKGRPGALSPSDFARAEEWYRAGVPLEAAIAAIDSAFESQARGRDRDAEEVNSLAYCESFLGKTGAKLNRRRGGRTRAPAR
jgi:hypothetical protein